MARPAQLQVNNSGTWKTVLKFNWDDGQERYPVEQAAVMLYEVSPEASWRIASCDRHPVVHAHMGKSTYGVWIAKKEETP